MTRILWNTPKSLALAELNAVDFKHPFIYGVLTKAKLHYLIIPGNHGFTHDNTTVLLYRDFTIRAEPESIRAIVTEALQNEGLVVRFLDPVEASTWLHNPNPQT